MKAAVLPRYGGPDSFEIRHVAAPMISYGEILVRNHASSVNPIDALVRAGKMRLITGIFGDVIIGADFAGVVIETKSELFKVGDRVFGFRGALKGGAYAEEIAVDASTCWLMPENYSYVEAAALPLVATTAWQGLVKDGDIASRQTILVNGCTGGVGCAAVQFIKDFGKHITGRCSTKNIAFAQQQLKCDDVIDYKDPIPADRKFDMIYDAAGKFTLEDVANNLNPNGVLVTTRGNLESMGSILNTAKDLLLSRQMKLVKVSPESGALKKIKELAEAGRFVSYVGGEFSLEQLSDAHRMCEKGGHTGKVGVRI